MVLARTKNEEKLKKNHEIDDKCEKEERRIRRKHAYQKLEECSRKERRNWQLRNAGISNPHKKYRNSF